MPKVNSPIKYPGGDHYSASWMISMMPKHDVYCETHAGSLSTLLAKNPEGVAEIANDINLKLTNFWNVLQDDDTFERFRMQMEATPFSHRQWKQAVSDRVFENDVDMACRFFVAANQSLAGRTSKPVFAPISTSRLRRGMCEQVSAWLTKVEGLPEVHARLNRVLILCEDATKAISRVDSKNTLFLVDPPFLHETRKTTGEYGENEMNAEQHMQLLEHLAGIEGKFMLEGYHSDLYDRFAKQEKWKFVEKVSANSAGGGKKKRRMIDVIWANFNIKSRN